MSKRILGLDFGSKTVGVAVSDPTGLIASGVEIIRREREDKLRQTLSRIEELVKEYDVEEIVLGLPVNMNNTKGERVEKTMAFKEMLERRIGLPVNLWDERLTTVEADEIMTEVGVKGTQDCKSPLAGNSIIEQRKKMAGKQAMKLISDAFGKDIKSQESIDKLRELKSQKLDELRDKNKSMAEIDEQKAATA